LYSTGVEVGDCVQPVAPERNNQARLVQAWSTTACGLFWWECFLLHLGQLSRSVLGLFLGPALALAIVSCANATTIGTPYRHVAILSGSGQAIVQNADNAVALYRFSDKLSVRQFRATDVITAFAASPDECRLVLGCNNGDISAWDVRTGDLLWQRSLNASRPSLIRDFTFTRDGGSFLVSDFEGNARIVDSKTGRDVRVLSMSPESPQIWAGAISPDGRSCVVMGLDNQLYAFDVESGHFTRAGISYRGSWIRYSLDGKYIAMFPRSSNDEEDLLIVAADGSWAVQKCERLGRIDMVKPNEDGGFLIAEFNHDIGKSDSIADWYSRGLVWRGDGERAKQLWMLRPFAARLHAMDFDPKAQIAVFTDRRLVTRMFDLNNGAELVCLDNSVNYHPTTLSTTSYGIWPLLWRWLGGAGSYRSWFLVSGVVGIAFVLLLWKVRRPRTG
jgi:PQQ-like domain